MADLTKGTFWEDYSLRHTAGPWYLGHDGYHDGARSVRAKNLNICHVNGGANDNDEAYANARLITAAPQMLEALESVLASVPFLSYRGDGELEECEIKVRRAIKAARVR